MFHLGKLDPVFSVPSSYNFGLLRFLLAPLVYSNWPGAESIREKMLKQHEFFFKGLEHFA